MKQVLVDEYGLDVVAIFKDYDAAAQLSSTMVLLQKGV
jgi:ABC-type hemin transport system ATPase subunit